MQNALTSLVTAICGAMIAVAAVIVMINAGLMPVNEAQLRGYLLAHPQLISEMSDAYQRQEDTRTAAVNAATMKRLGLQPFFDPKIAFVTGPANAANTMVEFYDYDCPYCRASLPAVKKFYDQHRNDTRFAFIERPLEQLHGPGAVLAAKASLAARSQPEHFLDFHFLMMSETEPLNQDMIMADARKAGLDLKKLQADMQKPVTEATYKQSADFAAKVQVYGTPTFVINGVMYPGAVDDESLANAIKKT